MSGELERFDEWPNDRIARKREREESQQRDLDEALASWVQSQDAVATARLYRAACAYIGVAPQDAKITPRDPVAHALCQSPLCACIDGCLAEEAARMALAANGER